MTIPEAVSLVVQAGAIGGRGEVFVLDMGEPVRIVDLAREHDPALGAEPGRDIRIDFIGAAAGREAARGAVDVGRGGRADGPPGDPHGHPAEIDAAWLDSELVELGRLVEAGSTLDLVGRLAAIVREPKRNGATAPVAGTAEAASATESV